MKEIVQEMQLTRTTKGTYFYTAPLLDTARIKSLYVQKEAFEGLPPPPKIVVTVAEAD